MVIECAIVSYMGPATCRVSSRKEWTHLLTIHVVDTVTRRRDFVLGVMFVSVAFLDMSYAKKK